MIKRIFVEKKNTVSRAARSLADEINLQLNETVSELRSFLRYDIEGIDESVFDTAVRTVFSEPPVDTVYLDSLPDLSGFTVFAAEYLPGQFDVRADSAAQCVQLLTGGERPLIRCAHVYALKNAGDIQKIQKYLINPVDSRIASNKKPESLKQTVLPPEPVKEISGFCGFSEKQAEQFRIDNGLAMSLSDVLFVQDYFKAEKREPTETEIRVLDTYWSDHCRHTTFLTELTSVAFETEIDEIRDAYSEYRELFNKHYQNRSDKYPCLMDLATMGARELKSAGRLPALDESEEINACSIVVKADTTDGEQDWLVMFKNETHNHPTEIEPFGGAATCLGGAIRDPLSGRAYVYHAMRVTGAGDITAPVTQTMSGKLPQRTITREAARGFSSYGNQIGLATGIVAEVYHPGFAAKRLETGFVVGAAPLNNVVRDVPAPGDMVILIGGETGRDGCGGATGSSKEHKEDSIETCGAEVQKGNPVTERKIQRLFRNPECAKLIKRCNDFGAGGVCVAIGELADGLLINLDAVPKKYEGLSGTELAISESQERMAVVIDPKDFDRLMSLCQDENLHAASVAVVTKEPRMVMTHNGKTIVELKRSLLSSNGVKQTARATVTDPIPDYQNRPSSEAEAFLKMGEYTKALRADLQRLNVSSNKGMSEMFDSTIGAGSVLMPFGGSKQLTPAIAMAAKLPVYPLDTDTATVCSWGYDPYLMSQSPFVGAQFSVLLSVAKVVAAGGHYDSIYLTFQEFFKRLKCDPVRWGSPVSAMLGALRAQLRLGLGAIGGKDSMSGSFLDIDVPPTLISFALGTAKASKLIDNVLKGGETVYRIKIPYTKSGCPDYAFFVSLMRKLSKNIASGKVKYATVTETGGAAAAVAKSCFGNGVGFSFADKKEDMFFARLADILLSGDLSDFAEFAPERIGEAGGKDFIFGQDKVGVETAESAYCKTIAGVFPIHAADGVGRPDADFKKVSFAPYKGGRFAKPSVFIPVFPGNNCEYDTAKKFLEAGATVRTFVFKNRSPEDIAQSAAEMARLINRSQIIAIPGGFSAGDEPDGSGKFIATAFRSPAVAEAVTKLLDCRQGLVLGICNGFQALIKLGLLPYGKIAPMNEDSATLYFNNIGRHISCLSAVRVCSVDSPWMTNCKVGDIVMTAVSHGEGRIIAPDAVLNDLKKNGRIITQYADASGKPSAQTPFNPNGSSFAIEGLISPDGRILGKMGHIERSGKDIFKNVPGEKTMDIFSAGVRYFK